MSEHTVGTIINELLDLATDLDQLPDISDVDMAVMYLRHLRRRHTEPALASV